MNFRESKLIRMMLSIMLIISLFVCCNSGEPSIIDCNTFKYKGDNYRSICGKYGIAEYTMSIHDEDSTTFKITCENGCLSSVSLVEKE